MIFRYPDLINGGVVVVDLPTQEEADALVQQMIEAVIQREIYRFSIAFELRDGKNTTWRSADLENDPEYGNYHVFNHVTGVHEFFEHLPEAKARREQLIEEYKATFANLKAQADPDPIPTETM